jgi:hypothetical protein
MRSETLAADRGALLGEATSSLAVALEQSEVSQLGQVGCDPERLVEVAEDCKGLFVRSRAAS